MIEAFPRHYLVSHEVVDSLIDANKPTDEPPEDFRVVTFFQALYLCVP